MDFIKNLEGALDERRIGKENNLLFLLREPNTTDKNGKMTLCDGFWARDKGENLPYYEYYMQVAELIRKERSPLAECCYYMNLNPWFGGEKASDFYKNRILPALSGQRDFGPEAEIARVTVENRMEIIARYSGSLAAIVTVEGIYERLKKKNAPEERLFLGRKGWYFYRSVTDRFGKDLPLYRIYHPDAARYLSKKKRTAALEKGAWENV